jgi:hypothetical protein
VKPPSNPFRTALARCNLTFLLLPLLGLAPLQSGAAEATPPALPTVRDGQHDFDFETGTWKTHAKCRLNPLTGSAAWVDYEGTVVVRTVWGGRANILELDCDGLAGHFQVLTLRLYNPQSHQWSLNSSSGKAGTMSQPAVGEFDLEEGRGQFYGQETVNGRTVLVKFVLSDIEPDSYQFERSFSDDGGRTWELNWIATHTRVTDAPAKSQ